MNSLNVLVVLCGFISGAGGDFCLNDTLIVVTNKTTESPETVKKELSLDDMIPLSLWDMVHMFSSGSIQLMGFVEGLQWFQDENGTTYFLAPSNIINDIEEQLKNNSDMVCFHGGICLTPERAQEYLENLKAERDRRLAPYDVTNFAVMVSFFIVVGIGGVAGNVLIITGVLRSASVRNSTTILLCSLSVSDIIVLMSCLPMQVLKKFFSNSDFFPQWLCGTFYFLADFSIVTSALTISAMAVDRYIAVCHPLKAKIYCTVRNSLIIVCCVWTFSSGLCVPVALMMIREQDDGKCRSNVRFHWQTYTYQTLRLSFAFLLPFLLILPFYLKITCVLWRSSRKSSELQGAGSRGENTLNESLRARIQITYFAPIIATVFLTSSKKSTASLLSLDVISTLGSIWDLLGSTSVFGSSSFNQGLCVLTAIRSAEIKSVTRVKLFGSLQQFLQPRYSYMHVSQLTGCPTCQPAVLGAIFDYQNFVHGDDSQIRTQVALLFRCFRKGQKSEGLPSATTTKQSTLSSGGRITK